VGATVVAVCPYCRAAGVRAWSAAVGSSATCPKCKSNFTIVADEKLPAWATKPAAPPAPDAATLFPTDTPPPSDAPPEPMWSSPLMAAEPAETEAEPPTLPAIGQTEAFQAVALVAIILVGPTVLASNLPYGRAIAILLAVLGLLAGLVCLIGQGKARLVAAAAVSLHGVLLVAVLFRPALLGLDPWRGTDPSPKPTEVRSVPHGKVESQTAGDAVDGAGASWVLGDVGVNVRRGHVGPVELVDIKGAKRKSREIGLQIVIRATNLGGERRIPLAGWMKGESLADVRLLDSSGKEVKRKSFPADQIPFRGRLTPDTLVPRESVDALLVFEAPSGKQGEFLLELPGSAVGVDRPIRFRLPASFLGFRP
jgi:hypothetical protein